MAKRPSKPAKRKSTAVQKSTAVSRSTALRKSVLMRRAAASKAAKVDLYVKHKNEYLASALPSFVRVGPARYLAFDGRGKPGAPDFATGIGAMYNVAFTVKMASKAAGRDYAVTKLESLWWREGDTSTPTKDTIWNWTLLIRVPLFVTAKDIQTAADGLITKGKPEDVRKVQLIELHEDTCVQIMHVGPYMQEAASIAKMKAFAEISGRTFTGKHHEIYMSDPRKVADDKLRTILRQPVS